MEPNSFHKTFQLQRLSAHRLSSPRAVGLLSLLPSFRSQSQDVSLILTSYFWRFNTSAFADTVIHGQPPIGSIFATHLRSRPLSAYPRPDQHNDEVDGYSGLSKHQLCGMGENSSFTWISFTSF
ncbi:hypothetical protein BDV11DRAFT_180301 [Aspergillus similis]